MALDQVFKFSVNANDVAKVTQMVKDICIDVHENEPGALVYYIYKVEGKNEFVAIERYQDQAAVEKHMSMPYFVKFAEEITPLILEEQELGTGQTIAGFTAR